MGRTTILDAFNAAAGFTNQALGMAGAYKQKQHDLELQNIWARSSTDIQNYIRDNPFNYTGDPNDHDALEKYTLSHHKMIGDYIDQEFDKAAGSNYAPYFRESIGQMKSQLKESARGMALNQEDAWKAEQIWVQFGRDAQSYMTLAPEEAWKNIIGAFDLLKTKTGVSPQKENEILEGLRTELYRKKYTDYFDDIKITDEDFKAHKGSIEIFLQNKANGFRSQFDNFLKSQVSINDDAGKPTGKFNENNWSDTQKEFEKKLIDFAIKRIQGEKKETALTDSALYHKWKEEALRTGNSALNDKAERLANEYRGASIREIEQKVKPEDQKFANKFDPSFHHTLVGLFQDAYAGGKSGSGASKTAIKALLEYSGKEVMKAYFNGETPFENARTILAVLPDMMYEQVEKEFGSYQGGKHQFFRDYTDYFLNMENALMEVAKSDGLRAMIPQRVEAFKRMIGSNQQLQKTLNKDYASQLEQMNKYFIEEYLDYLTSVNWNAITEAELMKGTQEIIGRLASADLKLIGQASSKSPFAGRTIAAREANLAEGLAAMERMPGAVSSRRKLNNPVYLPGSDSNPAMYEEGLRVYGTEAAQWIAGSQLSSNSSDREIREWAAKLRQVYQIDAARDEINPAAIFQYNNQGIFYRVSADPNNKKQIIIERQVTAGKGYEELQESNWKKQEVKRNRLPESTLDSERESFLERNYKANSEMIEEEIRKTQWQIEQNPNSRQLPQYLEQLQKELAEVKQFQDDDRTIAINQIRLAKEKDKEQLIKQYLRFKTITPEDAEKLRRGERL